MEEQVSQFYQAPPLLFLICIFSALSFVSSAWFWLFSGWKSNAGFMPYVWVRQGRAFIFVMILSLVLGAYDSLVYHNVFHWKAEAVIILLWLYIRSYHEGHSFKSMISIFNKSLYQGGACFLMAVITIGIAYSAFLLSGVFEIAVIASMGIWGLLIIPLYFHLKKNNGLDGMIRKSVHHYLWPVLLAYFVLMIPLQMQQVANSDKWQDMKRAKPIRQA